MASFPLDWVFEVSDNVLWSSDSSANHQKVNNHYFLGLMTVVIKWRDLLGVKYSKFTTGLFVLGN